MRKPAILMFSLLALVTVICFMAVTTIRAWTRQGDEVSFLAPSEWGFGRGWWDGTNGTGGNFYRYGILVRTTGMSKPRRP